MSIEEVKLVVMPEPPPEFQTESEKTAYAFGWWKALESVRAEKQEPVALSEEWQPCVKLPVTVHVRAQRPGETHVSTREGITPVKPDDLIMRGVSGEEYPIGREIFEKTYQLDEAPPPRQPEPVIDKSAAIRIATALGWTPPRQPLTHEQRFDLLTKFEPHKNKWEAPAILIDMVEAAHKIKGEA